MQTCVARSFGVVAIGSVLLALAAPRTAAQPLAESASVSGDSITRAFDANTDFCTFSDNPERNWATGNDHGSALCSAGPDNTFSHAERLECEAGASIARFNDAKSGADMGDFHGQAMRIRANLTSAPAPRYVPILLGHNDACTDTISRTGNSCGGDFDPNNYCRRTPAAFERELRRGMDELIQIPSARILVLALIRISQLCNFGGRNACALPFPIQCNVIWRTSGIIEDVFGAGGVCSSMTADCSSRRRIDMFDTLAAYNEVLDRVSAEYTLLAAGAASATGAVKANDVAVRYSDGTFYYKLQPADVSCCDCYHPSDLGQQRLAELIWNGLPCSDATQCCGASVDPLANARCDVVDTTGGYAGGFWADGARCGNGAVDPGETCDDGNLIDGDGCSATCMIEGATPTPSPTPGPCTGDCDGNGVVTVDELLIGVNIALGSATLGACPAFDLDGNGAVSVDDIIAAVDRALNGCG